MDSHTVNLKVQEPSADNSVPFPPLDFLTAWNLVASGNLDEAERVLRKSGEMPSSLQVLDFLARIAVRKGQYEQAAHLWRAVLEKDPTHEAAKAAIDRLGSPWIAIALIKRVAFLASIAVIFCLSIVGLFGMFNVVQQSRLGTAAQGVLSPVNSSPPETSDKINTPSKPANRESQIGAALSAFSVPGCSVHFNQGETRIVFDDGLFTLRCKLKNSAKERLSTFARLLRENSPNCRIIIEGHTDSYAMRKNSLYKDNYALGLQRALTVADILKSHHQIAGGRILVTSMGDTNPPFPGVDYESKLKNRTVVIRLF
ncbi:MAG: OmpA family protein [Proteobacteria bacterium]|nr:OmpA family protein [Pseudomonadota bacterium]